MKRTARKEIERRIKTYKTEKISNKRLIGTKLEKGRKLRMRRREIGGVQN